MKDQFNDDEKTLAYIKYEGEKVADGYMDAKKSGEVLIGIDIALRYFILKELPELNKIEFDLPVRVRKGSWEAIIPDSIGEMISAAIKLGGIWAVGKYAGSALSEMAKNDFEKIGFKDVIKASFKALIWVVKIANHVGTMTIKKFHNVSFSGDNKEVLLVNNLGEELWVPIEFIDIYVQCPDKLLTQLAIVIEDKRELKIGYQDGEITEISITHKQKAIFAEVAQDDEMLFPELVHDQNVELIGYITRGNENSNTIGFQYQGHILTCKPIDGNIKERKGLLFCNVIIRGKVDRFDKDGNVIEKRPRIIFHQIEQIEDQTMKKQTSLF